VSLPIGPFSIVYADPPWRYQDRGCNGNAEGHYSTMALEEIKALPVRESCARDAVLLMWATWPLMPEAMQVVSAWGFTYKTIGFLWVKKNRSDCGHFFGLGRWTRGNSEVCLLATRGKPKRASAAVEQLCFEPLTRHSEKPRVVRDRIVELLGDVPRLEMFARTSAAGWTVWGNEAPRQLQLEGPEKDEEA
jgi:N6-adenosine-specific RNA methylase IME4